LSVFESIEITAEEVGEDTVFTACLHVENSIDLPTEDVTENPDLKVKAQMMAAEDLIVQVFTDAIDYARTHEAPTPGRWLADYHIRKTRRLATQEEIAELRPPSFEDIEIVESKKDGRLYYTASLTLAVNVHGPKKRPDKTAILIFKEDMRARIRDAALRMCLEWLYYASKDFGIFNVHTWIQGLRFYESRWLSPGSPVLLMHPEETTMFTKMGPKEKPIIEDRDAKIQVLLNDIVDLKDHIFKTKKMGLIDRVLKRWPE